MKAKLHWKKGFLKETFEIYSNGLLFGTLKENIWKQIAYGELNGKKVIFKTHGFFKQQTQIIDPVTNNIVGRITYNSLITKATIDYTNMVANWEYDNIWNTKRSSLNSEGIKIRYYGSSISGQIDSNINDTLLILIGLYIINYYWKMTVTVLVAVFVAVFVPIWTIIIL